MGQIGTEDTSTLPEYHIGFERKIAQSPFLKGIFIEKKAGTDVGTALAIVIECRVDTLKSIRLISIWKYNLTMKKKSEV